MTVEPVVMTPDPAGSTDIRALLLLTGIRTATTEPSPLTVACVNALFGSSSSISPTTSHFINL